MESVDYLETSVNTNLRCLTFQKSENLIYNVTEAEIAQMSFLFTDVCLVCLFLHTVIPVQQQISIGCGFLIVCSFANCALWFQAYVWLQFLYMSHLK
jgi:hypothetical protein